MSSMRAVLSFITVAHEYLGEALLPLGETSAEHRKTRTETARNLLEAAIRQLEDAPTGPVPDIPADDDTAAILNSDNWTQLLAADILTGTECTLFGRRVRFRIEWLDNDQPMSDARLRALGEDFRQTIPQGTLKSGDKIRLHAEGSLSHLTDCGDQLVDIGDD